MKSGESPISMESEEYLEAIYRLEEKVGFARTVELARRLKVVAGSVTNTIENLERRGLVIHEPYKGVKLTEKGRKLALNVLRRHRLAERLLTDILHLDRSEAHDEACRLEHAITAEIIKPLEKALGHPKTCPHGNPIPLESGEMVEDKSEPLGKLEPHEKGVVVKVIEEKSDILQYLSSLDPVPSATVEIEEKALQRDHRRESNGIKLRPRLRGSINYLVKKSHFRGNIMRNDEKSDEFIPRLHADVKKALEVTRESIT